MQQNFGKNFRLHLQESGVFEMEVVEVFELILRVHQTERYRIKSIENNAVVFLLHIAANLVRPGTSFPSTHLPAPFTCRLYKGLTNEFDLYRLEWINVKSKN
jgi:hypothetical protein